MADEQEKWLDRDAAERLLRGEPLDDVDPHARVQADRLAQALGALAADDRGNAPAEAELPGEAAALAAFRAAHADSAKAGARAPFATAAHETAAAETVRLGRATGRPRPSRWGRPVRLGLAAALAGCMIGGVAVAAGTGVLPSPFGQHHEPGPAASASPVASPEAVEASPSEDAGEPSEGATPDGSAAPEGDETTREPETARTPEAEAGGAPTTKPTRRPGGGEAKPPPTDSTKDWYRKVVIACRDYRSGGLRGEKRRRLEEFAKGSARIEEFCGRILAGGHQGGGQPTGGQQGGGSGDGGDGGGEGRGEDGDGDSDQAPGGDGGAEGGSGGDTGHLPAPPPPSSPVTPAASHSSPAPAHTA
ncbi:hypothetical protein [Streptomyces sp. DSM 118878]